MTKEYYLANKERIAAQQKAYYQANAEAKKAAARRRYAEDPETHLKRARQYRKENWEELKPKARRRCADRRARKRDQFVESVEPQIVYETHGGMCGICEQFIDGPFEVDHVVPLSRGGLHSYSNVQPAHSFCNRSKGARLMEQSSLPNEPIQVIHLECGSIWEVYAIEWPPRVTFCTKCKIALKLVGQDKITRKLAYRKF